MDRKNGVRRRDLSIISRFRSTIYIRTYFAVEITSEIKENVYAR